MGLWEVGGPGMSLCLGLWVCRGAGGRCTLSQTSRDQTVVSPGSGCWATAAADAVSLGEQSRSGRGGGVHFLWLTVHEPTIEATVLRPLGMPEPSRGAEETGHGARAGWGSPASRGCVSSGGGDCCGPSCLLGPQCCCFSIKPELTELGSCEFLKHPRLAWARKGCFSGDAGQLLGGGFGGWVWVLGCPPEPRPLALCWPPWPGSACPLGTSKEQLRSEGPR